MPSSWRAKLHQLQNNHLGSVAATGSELVDAGVTAGAILLRVASLVLRADLAEELLHHRMLVILGALLELLLVLVVLLLLLQVSLLFLKTVWIVSIRWFKKWKRWWILHSIQNN